MLSHIVTRKDLCVVGLVAGLMLTLTGSAQSSGGDPAFIRICVNKRSGEVRAIKSNRSCRHVETAIDLPVLTGDDLIVPEGDLQVAQGDLNITAGDLNVTGNIHATDSLKVGNSIIIDSPGDIITATSGTITFDNTGLTIEAGLDCAANPCINNSDVAADVQLQLVPAGAVMFFNTSTCPTGWQPLAAAEGRYLVGLPGGGVPGTTVGMALTDGENRPVGQHTHTINDPGHAHGFSVFDAGSGREVATWDDDNGDERINFTHGALTGISVNSAGLVPGTNAPYLELLVCEKLP